MTSLKISGAVTILGALLFLVAAFLPISSVYALRDATAKQALIAASPRAWTFSHLLFAVGAWLATMGVAFAALTTRGQTQPNWLFWATACLLVGAAAWIWYLYQRALDPAAFTNGTLSARPFAVYTLLANAAFVLAGIAVLQLGFGLWSGWILIVGALVLLALYAIFGDMPPFAHYVLAIVLGVVLFRNG